MNTDNDALPLRPVNLVRLKMVREKHLGYNNPICSSADVVNLVKSQFQNSYREAVIIMGVDSSNRPTIIHTVSVGSPSQAAVSISSVFKPLLLSNSVAFILIHNHCSSSSTITPSNADKDLTEKLKEIGKQLEVQMLDHLILNSDCSNLYSFKSHGVL